MRYLMALMLVLCLVSFVAAQEVVGVEAPTTELGQKAADLKVYIGAVMFAIFWILEKLGKKKLLEKVKGVAEAGRIAFNAIEEAGAGNVKTLVKHAMGEQVATPATKEAINVLHASADKKAAKKLPRLQRFWRRALSGKNLAGVVARSAAKAAFGDLLENRKK